MARWASLAYLAGCMAVIAAKQCTEGQLEPDGDCLVCLRFDAECETGETCDKENKIERATNCREYKICKSGLFYKISCGFSRVFDPIQGKCVWVWPWHKCEINLNTKCLEGQTKILGCKLYSKCISEVWHRRQCREGETVKDGQCVKGICVFSAQSCDEYIVNGEQLKCASGHYFDEMLSRCIPGTCDVSEKDTNAACKVGEAKRIEGSCKKYELCKEGTMVSFECDQCQNFDDNEGKCMFVWDSPCTEGTVTPAPTSTSTPASPCKTGERKPDYESCSKYYECDGKGIFQHKSCAWYFLFKFDVNTLQCKFWNAHCAKHKM